MSVRGLLKLCNPDQAEASLTLTMTIREWKELRASLTNDYPAWRVGSMIGKLVAQASQAFAEEGES